MNPSVAFIQFTIHGRRVRFYAYRKDAAAHAKSMADTLKENHEAIKHPDLGWLVANTVQKTMHDIDGPLPMDVLKEIRDRG